MGWRRKRPSPGWDEALQLLGLAGARHEPPHRVSRGCKQLVAIAGIVAIRPRYIVLEEPTTLLDPAGRAEVLAALTRLCRQEGMGAWADPLQTSASSAQTGA